MTPVLCEDRFPALVAALGRPRFADLAEVFSQRLGDLLAALPGAEGARGKLIARTHQIRGAAGTLGLLALAEGLERLEMALAKPGADSAAAIMRQATVVELDHRAAREALALALAEAERDHSGDSASR